jgi:hypothetical protein
MIDYAIKCCTLLIITLVAFGIVLSDSSKGQKLKANFISTNASDLDVVTIESERPSKPVALPVSKPEIDLETFRPTVKADDTKDKIAALDERVTRLESQYKAFASTKSSNGSTGGGSTGGGSTGSVAAKTATQSSVGYGSTGTNTTTTVYQSQAIPYASPVVTPQPVRLQVLRRSTSSPKNCVVDQYGRVICR